MVKVADALILIRMYDIDKDKWYVLPELPFARNCFIAVPEKKQVLAVGGTDDTFVTNKVFLWDKNSQKWLTPYPNNVECMVSLFKHFTCVNIDSSW